MGAERVLGQRKTLVRLTVYAIVCMVAFAWLANLISNRAPWRDRAVYEAVLSDATGLYPDDTVRVGGVVVGRVQEVEIERGQALVRFEVDRDVGLPTDTEVGLRWRNLTGQRFLYLYPGRASEQLAEGERFGVDRVRHTVQLSDLLDSLAPVLAAVDVDDLNSIVAALSEGLGEDGEALRALLADAAVVADTVGGLDTEVDTIITEFDRALSTLATHDQELDRLLVDVSLVSSTLRDNDELLVRLVTDLERLLDQIDGLVTDSRGDLEGILAALGRVAGTLAAQTEDLDTTLATLGPGLAGYHEISSTGQWFLLRAIAVCLPGIACVTEDPRFGGIVPAPVPNDASSSTGGTSRAPPAARAMPTGLAAFFRFPSLEGDG